MKNNSFDLNHFFTPPNEYGIVSFYWWVGEELKKDRLLWQLEQLSEMDICGLQVNYCHTDAGGQVYGLPFESKPRQFSNEWWDLFNWFLAECEKRDISVSLSDYTLGTPGQGYYTDEILHARPELRGGTIECSAVTLKCDEHMEISKNDCRIAIYAYPVVPDGVDIEKAIDLSGKSSFTAENGDYIIAETEYIIEPFSLDPMHKDSGAEVVDKFFNRFEKHNPGECGKALNFFFSDELNFGVGGNLWNLDVRDEFLTRKGYDILPYLYGIFADIGPFTPKVRLDYYDVIVSLEEDNYFEPVFLWHEERGMTYGCDHGGRGYDVTEFGDYFRTQKYNQGPGNDQPNLSSDIIKNKVSSSISHLYSRPRTWLEGFYGSGWGTSSGQLLDAICRNFAMGHNLLSLHGLYYTTYGGFWEWAPPCNHFRMPYWRHMKKLTECVKRMSYMNTRGVHQCDAAIIYPVAAVEGGLGGEKSVETAFSLGKHLYKNGVDFDFLDFNSLERAEIRDNEIEIAGKCYRAIIVPSMKTIRFSSLQKLSEFKKAGGLVICIGDLPEASDRAGRCDKLLDAMVAELFDSYNTLDNPEAVLNAMDAVFVRDFKVLNSENTPYFMHRKTDDAHLYTVYGLEKGTKCFFRTHGTPILLDPLNKIIHRIAEYEQTADGMIIPLPLNKTRPQILLFSDAGTYVDFPELVSEGSYTVLPVGEAWQCRLLTTMDNKYGDFSLPAENSIIGAQIRRPEVNNIKTTLGFGPYFKLYGPVPPSEISKSLEDKLMTDPESAEVGFGDYIFSMRYGREDDPGHQGWHGLKGKISDEFITLGKQVDHHHEYRYEEEIPDGVYYMYTYVFADKEQTAELLIGSLKPDKIFVNGKTAGQYVRLSCGYNLITVKFSRPGRTYVVLLKENTSAFTQEMPLAMHWYKNPNLLPFDINKGTRNNVNIHFESPPAFEEMSVYTDAELKAYVDGKPALCRKADDKWIVENPAPTPYAQQVEIIASPTDDRCGGAVIERYIDVTCGEGIINVGDFGKTDGLEHYSGGMSYRQEFTLPEIYGDKKIKLSLGEVVSTAEIIINGKSTGVIIAPPFEADISEYVSTGKNYIEVTLYNTLYNHYRTVPTKYNYPQKSGLIGPVELRIYGGE